MDLMSELDNMATNIEDGCDTEYRPAEDEIARWQSLFSYSYSEAAEQIIRHKNDISRSRVPDELWNLVRSEKEVQGYSREAFEHELSSRHHHTPTHPQPSSSSTSISASQPDSTTTTYLVLLFGPFTTAQRIQSIASLPSLPSIYPATSEQTGDTQHFCRITASTKADLQSRSPKLACKRGSLLHPDLRPRVACAERSFLNVALPNTRSRVDLTATPLAVSFFFFFFSSSSFFFGLDNGAHVSLTATRRVSSPLFLLRHAH